MPYQAVNDINMYYRVSGAGYPLVMIMGLAGNSDWWPDEFIERLSQDYRVILIDNRGAGRTDAPDMEYSIPMMARDTVSLMGALGIDKAHVMGISMGGMIAQEIALLFPDAVDKLALGCTNCGPAHSVPATAETVQILAESITSPEKTLDLVFTPDFLKNSPEKVKAFVQSIAISPMPAKVFFRQLGAIQAHDTFERLPQIKHNTLIITGDMDVLVPPQNSRILAEHIPAAQLITIPGGGHLFFNQYPGKVYTVLKEFLG
jgi:pimeloyl-ACP methyl ester carboxylesterase